MSHSKKHWSNSNKLNRKQWVMVDRFCHKLVEEWFAKKEIEEGKPVFDVVFKYPKKPTRTLHQNGTTFYFDENDECYAQIKDYDELELKKDNPND